MSWERQGEGGGDLLIWWGSLHGWLLVGFMDTSQVTTNLYILLSTNRLFADHCNSMRFCLVGYCLIC